jgi:cell division septation protein DedD
MNMKLKRRLIVAIIILALVVIFVPMLFKQHENYSSHNVVMITPAVSPPAPRPQQPEVMPPTTQSTNQANNNQVPNKQIKMIRAIAIPVANQEVAKQEIVTNPKNQKVTKPQIAKPKITQTAIKVTKIKPIQTKPDNLAKTSTHKPLTTSSVKAKPVEYALKSKSRLKSHASNVFYLTQTSSDKPFVITSKPPKMHTSQQKSSLSSFKPPIKPKPNENAYVVQLGVFSNDKNAHALIHHLRTNGFTSFGYKQKQKGNRILTHVYVGPLVTRQHAKQMVRQLQKIMKIKGEIVPFDATKMYSHFG